MFCLLSCFFHIINLALLTDDVGMIGHKGKDCQAREGEYGQKDLKKAKTPEEIYRIFVRYEALL